MIEPLSVCLLERCAWVHFFIVVLISISQSSSEVTALCPWATCDPLSQFKRESIKTQGQGEMGHKPGDQSSEPVYCSRTPRSKGRDVGSGPWTLGSHCCHTGRICSQCLLVVLAVDVAP